MRKTTLTFEDVRKIGLALPDVEESTMFGAPALKLRGNLLACLPTHKSAEPGSLAVRIDFDQRAGLLAEAPETFYLTEHYVGYSIVLVRFSEIRIDQLKDLLAAAWRFVGAQKRKPAKRLAAAGKTRITRRAGK